jgi:N-acetylglucosamine-6-phosphate deacetylase
VPIPEAVDAVTRTPARILRRQDVGRLAVGAPADLVVLDDELVVADVLVAGALVT